MCDSIQYTKEARLDLKTHCTLIHSLTHTLTLLKKTARKKYIRSAGNWGKAEQGSKCLKMYTVKNGPLYHFLSVGVLILYYHTFLPERLNHVCGCGCIFFYLLRFFSLSICF